MSEICSTQKTCRTCLANLNIVSVSVNDDVLIKDKCTISIKNILSSTCFIEIIEGDGLPDVICSNCTEKVKDIYIFRLQCKNSEKILKKNLVKTKIHNWQNVVTEDVAEERNSPNTVENISIIKDDINTEIAEVKCDIKSDTSLQIDTNITKHYCSLCDLYFNWKIRYNEHMRKFHKFSLNCNTSKHYSCTRCRRTFRILSNLEKHSKKCDTDFENKCILNNQGDLDLLNDSANVCPSCRKNFLQLSELKAHLKTHIKDNKFSCTSCDKSFCNETNLEKHIAKQHLQPHICNVCGKNFLNHRKLRLHKACHTAESDKKYQCKYCVKKFNQIHHLENHERIHTGQKPYLCNECGKDFRQQYALTLHMRIHTGDKPYICQECGKAFNRKQGLDSHLLCHNAKKEEDDNNEDTTHICSDCGIRVTRLRTLAKHMWQVHNKGADPTSHAKIKTESNIKNDDKTNKDIIYTCNVCHFTFETNYDLRQHMKIHAFQHICGVCSRAFMLPSQLEAHARFHTGTARLHPCSYAGCARSFNRPEHARAHFMRAHTTERPYQCEICLKGFCQSGDLKVHMRYHTGERPYDCTFCDKSFAASSALKGHIRRHTGERPYCCSICQNGYFTSTELNLHMKSHTSKSVNVPTDTAQNKNIELK